MVDERDDEAQEPVDIDAMKKQLVERFQGLDDPKVRR
jgi:hypothetical protein